MCDNRNSFELINYSKNETIFIKVLLLSPPKDC